ncbi:hypothetical protein BpHYR1_021730 [Brachionus plicatilis]|uniref:Uncharacterized protein n=1 Tax=Brachionus plicatilis TaxID=10195 RepID=A0A3M7PYG0_BRAPC|nr:hypothetical protein BpHYR1_021730 [Brachionus plicatilis]
MNKKIFINSSSQNFIKRLNCILFQLYYQAFNAFISTPKQNHDIKSIIVLLVTSQRPINIKRFEQKLSKNESLFNFPILLY